MGFGVLTILAGGGVLFGPESTRQAAGNIVLFVLWFNFLAGFLYLLAGNALWQGKRSASRLAGWIALATVLVFIALGVHISAGGWYENRTLAAMTFRSTFWIFIYLYARKQFMPGKVSSI